MRVETHPRQSLAISIFATLTALFSVGMALERLGWTPATHIGLGLSFALALLVGWMRAGTWAAALAGGLLMADLYLATVSQPNGPWWATAVSPLALLLVLTLLATRFRRSNKEKEGLAEDRQGRSASQVCANLGMAALAASMTAVPGARTLALLAMTASLVETTADTLSSELGQAVRGRTILLTTGQIVPPGTDGGISVSGTLAGISGGLLVALAGQISLHLSWRRMLVAWMAGLAGLFFDSLLGATLERRGLFGNNAVNFCSTVLAAGLAVIAGIWMR
jgi:uncharacterized protein (TIGR00297 family)